MKALKIAWFIFVKLVTLFFVFLIFSIPNTDFERIVLSILVIIYVTIQSSLRANAIDQMNFKLALANEFRSIREELTKISEEHDEKWAEINQSKNKIENRIIANIVFDFIVYLVAAFNILSAL